MIKIQHSIELLYIILKVEINDQCMPSKSEGDMISKLIFYPDIPSIKWEDKVRALSDIQGPKNLLFLNPFFQEATIGENPLK